MTSIAIVTPVLNDWPSFEELVRRINLLEDMKGSRVTVIAVDDGSTSIKSPPRPVPGDHVQEIRILKLQANQGHQRAIALGLAYVHRELTPDIVLVMDSDGEDRPIDIRHLIEAHKREPGKIVVAQRRRRSEGLSFRLFYKLYKRAFSLLTGKPISFGNFSLIPADRLSNVIFAPGIWNNFAATILKCRIPLVFVGSDRGNRYFGSSKMNFTSLMVHGFSAISVFTDIVIGRIISFLVAACLGVTGGILGIIALKFATATFIAGYATTLIMFLVTLLSVTMFTGFMTILSLLAAREQASTLPVHLLDDLVSDTIIYPTFEPKAASA